MKSKSRAKRSKISLESLAVVSFATSFVATWQIRAALLPVVSSIGLFLSLWCLGRAWKHSVGLAIRPVIAWGFVAVIFGLLGQISAFAEPFESGRPIAGHWVYLAALATLASLISSLGARTPGGGAWAILMGLLMLVLLIPWLEGFGLRSGQSALGQLRIDAPWSIFYGLLVLAGVTNYLPTAFCRSAVLIGSGLVVEFVALTFTHSAASTRANLWCLVPFLMSLGILVGTSDFRRRPIVGSGLPALWLWFRDLWGVVWALRVRERFQKTAESAGWSLNLAWNGPTTPDGHPSSEIPPEAVKTLEMLLRRFATHDRIREARDNGPHGACPDEVLTGQ